MKRLSIVLAITFLTVSSLLSARADTNIALAGGTYGPGGILGFNAGSTLTFGNGSTNVGSANDGNTAFGSARNDTFGQANPSDGFVGITFNTPVTLSINSVTFYGGIFFDGGWFGVNGKGSDGVDNNTNATLSAAALIAPTLQVSYDYTSAAPSASTWVNVPDSNSYVTQLTGSATGSPYGTPAVTPGVTFTLNTPVTGITGIRLIGEDGGYSSGGGGFLGEYEFQVNAGAVPEPSIYAMMCLGLCGLVFLGRRKLT